MKPPLISTLETKHGAILIQYAASAVLNHTIRLTKRLLKLFVCLIALFTSPTVLATGFVSIQVDSAEVRVGPGAKSDLIGTVKRSTILAARGSESGWTRVVMPSGEYRYVLSASTQPNAALPPFIPPTQMPAICSELLKAERRSVDEATKVEPNIMKQIELQRVLSDRYKLAIYTKNGIHVAHDTAASVWCAKR
jgi:hypothetical protein